MTTSVVHHQNRPFPSSYAKAKREDLVDYESSEYCLSNRGLVDLGGNVAFGSKRR